MIWRTVMSQAAVRQIATKFGNLTQADPLTLPAVKKIDF